jgi:general secretion pathway protein C
MALIQSLPHPVRQKMQAVSSNGSSIAQSAAVSALYAGALVMLGLVLAYWTWAWFAPPPEPRSAGAEQSGVRAAAPSLAASGLFGRAGSNPAVAAAGSGSIRLLGVVAASGSFPAYAIVRMEPQGILAVRAGDDIAPGIRLAAVHADGVVLERTGRRESLAFPDRRPATGKP